jgi:hypothetical protein
VPTAAAVAAMSSCQWASEWFGQPSKLCRPGILSRVAQLASPGMQRGVPVLCRTLPWHAEVFKEGRDAGCQRHLRVTLLRLCHVAGLTSRHSAAHRRALNLVQMPARVLVLPVYRPGPTAQAGPSGEPKSRRRLPSYPAARAAQAANAAHRGSEENEDHTPRLFSQLDRPL